MFIEISLYCIFQSRQGEVKLGVGPLSRLPYVIQPSDTARAASISFTVSPAWGISGCGLLFCFFCFVFFLFMEIVVKFCKWVVDSILALKNELSFLCSGNKIKRALSSTSQNAIFPQSP